MSNYLLTIEAERELLRAYRWYERRSAAVASRFLRSAEVLFQRMADEPQLFGIYRGIHRFGTVRKFPYVVMFRQARGLVIIEVIGHEKRSNRFWKRRLR